MAIKITKPEKTKTSKATTAKTASAVPSGSSVSKADQIREKLKAKFKTAIRVEGEEMDLVRVPTGVLSIDLVLGGGVPKGRIVEVYGPESTGKSAFASLSAGAFQKEGAVLGYNDVEQAWNPSFAKVFGVDYNTTVFAQPDHGEEALQIANDMVDAGIGLMIYDSVGATMPKQELEGEMDEQNMGGPAKMINKGVKKLISKCNRNKSSAIFINQLRSKIGVMFGNPNTTTGGNSLKYFASIRLSIFGSALKEGEERVGIIQRIKTDKQKTAKFHKDVTVELNWDFGYDNVKDLTSLASELGIITKAGSWLSFNGERVQGEKAMTNLLLQKEDLIMSLLETVVAKLIENKKLPSNYNLALTKELFKDHLERRRKAVGVVINEEVEQVTDDNNDFEDDSEEAPVV